MLVKELFAKLGLELDEKGFEAGEKWFEVLKGGLVGIGAAASATALALAGIAKRVSDAGYQASRMAERTGLSTQEFQALTYAAHSAGEFIPFALRGLSRAMFQARLEGGMSAYAFQRLGVSMHSTGGQAKSTHELFLDLADAIAKMPDGVEKMGIVTRLFGREAVSLIHTLNKGREGILEEEREAGKLGVVMGTDLIEASVRFRDEQERADAALKGLGYTVGAWVLPAFTNMLTNTWKFYVALRPVVDKVFSFVTSFKFLQAAVIASSVILGTVFLPQIATAAFLVWTLRGQIVSTALEWVKSINLMALKTTALRFGVLAILALIIDDLYQWVTGGNSLLAEFFGPRETAKQMLAWRAWGDDVTEWLDGLNASIGNFFTTIGNWLTNKVRDIGRVVGKGFRAIFGDEAVDDMMAFWKNAFEKLDALGAWLWNKFKEVFLAPLGNAIKAGDAAIQTFLEGIPGIGKIFKSVRVSTEVAAEALNAGVPVDEIPKRVPGEQEEFRLAEHRPLGGPVPYKQDFLPEEKRREWQGTVDRYKRLNDFTSMLGGGASPEAAAKVGPIGGNVSKSSVISPTVHIDKLEVNGVKDATEVAPSVRDQVQDEIQRMLGDTAPMFDHD